MHKPVYRSRAAIPVPSYFLSITLVSAVAVLVPYVMRLDAGRELPGALYGIGIWVVAFAAMFARWRLGLGLLPAVLAAAAGVPVAVIGKVLWDVVADPASHVHWPFEIAVAVLVGIVAALIGALAGWVMAVLVPAAKPC